jgi:hypothetical protein
MIGTTVLVYHHDTGTTTAAPHPAASVDGKFISPPDADADRAPATLTGVKPSLPPHAHPSYAHTSTDPAFMFHRRGKHSTLSMSSASMHAYLSHGGAPLVRGIDPPNAAIFAPPLDASKACFRIPSAPRLAHDSESNPQSIRASPTSSNERSSFFRAHQSHVPLACSSSDDRHALPGSMVLHPHTIGAPPTRRTAADACNTEVLSVCPCASPTPEPLPTSPVTTICASSNYSGGGTERAPLPNPGVSAPASADGDVDDTAFAATSVAELKQRSLLDLPSPTPPQRCFSVIPSELYAESPPASEGATAVAQEPRTVARAGRVLSGLIRRDTPPPTEVPALLDESSCLSPQLDADDGASSSTNMPPLGGCSNCSGCGAGLGHGHEHVCGVEEPDALQASLHTLPDPEVSGDVLLPPCALRHLHDAHALNMSGHCIRAAAEPVEELGGVPTSWAAQSWGFKHALGGPDEGDNCNVPQSDEYGRQLSSKMLGDVHSVGVGGVPDSEAASGPHQQPARIGPYICEIDPWDDGSQVLGSDGSEESGCGPLPGGSAGDMSLQWQENAWTGSTWRGRGLQQGGGSCGSGMDPLPSVSGGSSGRQLTVLSALPTDTPAGLLFGVLMPLMLGWHIVLEDSGFGGGVSGPAEGTRHNGVWAAAAEYAPVLDGILMSVSHCDAFMRGAMEALTRGESEAEEAANSAPFSLARVRACAIFGPCLTPPVAQSFVAAMQPFGLRCALPVRGKVSACHTTCDQACVQ